MTAETIFAPVSVLALWTGAVLLLTGYRRIRAVVKGRLPANAFKLGESPEVPPEIAVANRNLMNLLEMPQLFYVACVAIYVTHNVEAAPVALAWTYVGLRVGHSLVHITSNRVTRRLALFALSNFVLLAIWLWFIARLF